MARTAVTLQALVGENTSGLADPAGTTINSTLVTNGVNVATVSEAIPPARGGFKGIFIRVANSDAGGAHNLIVRKGVNPPAFEADLGDLTVSVPLSSTVWVGPFDMARHAQSDDSINIDFSTGFTGTLTVFSLPRSLAN